jgi:hypothetical protein
VKFGTTVTALFASLMLVSASATASAAQGPGPKGYDVSYPQCTGALPADQAFGIVAVNGGLANTTNPCLDDEISWALTGPVSPASPLYRLPDWIPGARTLAQARKNCRLAPLTGGGSVTLTQWKTKPANSDFSCPPPPKAKAR